LLWVIFEAEDAGAAGAAAAAYERIDAAQWRHARMVVIERNMVA
jgi:hypothetical protein